ncbi:MAG: adenosylcobinamide-GDP ribazoletransferase [Clostridia bacterium]
MRILNSLWIALSTYSKLPVPHVDFSDDNRRWSMAFFPVVGLVIAGASLIWLAICDALALGEFLRGAVGCLIPLFISGGLHMDGFMDTMDAIASWQTRERRLEILKDSHVGAFAVIGCAGYLLFYAALLSRMTFGRVACVWAIGFVLSRALSAILLLRLPSARPGGMLDGFRASADAKNVQRALVVCCAACALGALALHPVAGLLMLGACALSAGAYRHMALKKFGGTTGDLAGWFLQVCELTCAIFAVASGLIG